MALLRHGGMRRVFNGCYAPSTLGSFLRAFTFGHVRQLDAVAARFLTGLGCCTPLLTAADGAGRSGRAGRCRRHLVEVHGYAKQGAGFGYSKVRGLNALLATVTTASSAPVIVAQRLRKGSCGSPAGREAAGRRRADAACCRDVAPGRPAAGAGGLGVLRPRHRRRRPRPAARRLGHRPPRRRGEGGDRHDRRRRVDPDRVPRAIFDEPSGRWISRAEVAEITFTAFASPRRAQQVPGRLVVRRIPELNPTGQDGLFDVWRFHAFFTTSDPDRWTRWPRTRPTAATPSSNKSTPT